MSTSPHEGQAPEIETVEDVWQAYVVEFAPKGCTPRELALMRHAWFNGSLFGFGTVCAVFKDPDLDHAATVHTIHAIQDEIHKGVEASRLTGGGTN